jgi:hypothetical protein
MDHGAGSSGSHPVRLRSAEGLSQRARKDGDPFGDVYIELQLIGCYLELQF